MYDVCAIVHVRFELGRTKKKPELIKFKTAKRTKIMEYFANVIRI